MRARWPWLCAALIGLVGCTTSKPDLRPPKRPEDFNVPPEAEARFSKPITYPPGDDNNPLKKKGFNGNNALSNPSRFGMGGAPGMGGMGMGR